MEKFLVRYPFSDPRVRLVEGFLAYDGAIGDEPGTPHKAIDYVLGEAGTYRSFEVYAMHAGEAFRGVSESWGSFVVIYLAIENIRYATVYAHLDQIDPLIAPYFLDPATKQQKNPRGTVMTAGRYLGITGTSGWTDGIPQLHLELHRQTPGNDKLQKLDPYGLNDRASSGRYPQPGHSLAGLDHAWATDLPPLVTP